MARLAEEYARQALAMRRKQPRPLASWFGVHLGSNLPDGNIARQLVKTFNMVSIPMTWRTIEAVEGRRNWSQVDAQTEWAQSAGLRICAGPLLELDDRGVPWLADRGAVVARVMFEPDL